MTKCKAFALLIIIIAISVPAAGQHEYRNAVGCRLGGGYYDLIAASYKTFISQTPSALEFNLGFKP